MSITCAYLLILLASFGVINVIALVIVATANGWDARYFFVWWGCVIGDCIRHNDARAKLFGLIALIAIGNAFLNGHGGPLLAVDSVKQLSHNATIRYHLEDAVKEKTEETRPEDRVMARLGNFLGQGQQAVVLPTPEEELVAKFETAVKAQEKKDYIAANTIQYPSWWHWVVAALLTAWTVLYWVVAKREEIIHDIRRAIDALRKKDDSEAGGTAGGGSADPATAAKAAVVNAPKTLIGWMLGIFLSVEFLELLMNIINWWRGKESKTEKKDDKDNSKAAKTA